MYRACTKLLPLCIALLLIVGCINTGDRQIILDDTIPSPDGSYVAYVYTEMSGGAAGSCDRTVQILEAGEEFVSGELPILNAETWDKEMEKVVFSHGDCATEFDLVWLEPDHLQITYPVGWLTSTLQNARSHHVDVNLSYVPLSVGDDIE